MSGTSEEINLTHTPDDLAEEKAPFLANQDGGFFLALERGTAPGGGERGSRIFQRRDGKRDYCSRSMMGHFFFGLKEGGKVPYDEKRSRQKGGVEDGVRGEKITIDFGITSEPKKEGDDRGGGEGARNVRGRPCHRAHQKGKVPDSREGGPGGEREGGGTWEAIMRSAFWGRVKEFRKKE